MEIRLEGVAVRLRGQAILEGVDVRIPSGRTVTVVGPSGSGKTTLVKLVNGLVRPTSGQVFLDRRPLDYARILEIRRRIGYVMQEAGLLPHLTVEENVALPARLAGWPWARVAQRVMALLRMLNLPDPTLLKRLPRSLSGGQRQRVAIARALVLDPPVLLMDEPFSALDPVVRRELQEEFLRLRAALQQTVLFVTHDFAEAHRLGERILLMNAGRIEQEASPAEFVSRPATPLAAAFVATARGIEDTPPGGVGE